MTFLHLDFCKVMLSSSLILFIPNSVWLLRMSYWTNNCYPESFYLENIEFLVLWVIYFLTTLVLFSIIFNFIYSDSPKSNSPHFWTTLNINSFYLHVVHNSWTNTQETVWKTLNQIHILICKHMSLTNDWLDGLVFKIPVLHLIVPFKEASYLNNSLVFNCQLLTGHFCVCYSRCVSKE